MRESHAESNKSFFLQPKFTGIIERICMIALAQLVVLLLFASVPAFADSWNFSTPTGGLGTSQVYSALPSGLTITAYGYLSNGVLGQLYGTNSATDMGLGLKAADADHEITGAAFIDLDVSALFGKTTSNMITFSSTSSTTTGADSWEVFKSNSKGTVLGEVGVLAGSDENSHSITLDPTFTYLVIQATSGNVLLSSFSATVPGETPVPEPSSLLLFGTGLLGVAGALRRKLLR